MTFGGLSQTTTSQAHESWDASLHFRTNIELLQALGNAVIYFLGCAMVLDGSADYGDVTAFTTYAMQILWPAVRFSQLAEQLQSVNIAAGRLFEILDEQPQVVDRPGARDIGKSTGRIDFENVSFEYEKDRPVIKAFDLHIKPGETIALVGPTGCGKSTILSLLMRLYDVCGGAVKLDGVDLRDIRLASLRHQFGIVLQESLLFTVSISDNIRYARPDATQEEIEAAARVAEIHDEILRLPRGYESVIGDRDVQLSVGQKQRLAIARALLTNPPILIFDEATSALDPESEEVIRHNLKAIARGRTVLIVSHRLSIVSHADCIVVIDHGKISEKGTHRELVGVEGIYRDFWNQQMSVEA